MVKILFAEDEAILGKLVKEALERNRDWEIHWCRDGADALRMYRAIRPDICVLDVMMPAMDGFTLAREIRTIDENVPILFLTARSQTADVVKGFESGGNDYLKKPFSLEELGLRVKELLRRSGSRNLPAEKQAAKDHFAIGKFIFYPATQTLKSPTASHNLSYKESELLHELLLHKNDVMERKMILLKLWGDDNFFNARNMDVYIVKLRKYLAEDSNLAIVSIRGVGYKLIEHAPE
jgi:DNA-binding response OmpR family regulator